PLSTGAPTSCAKAVAAQAEAQIRNRAERGGGALQAKASFAHHLTSFLLARHNHRKTPFIGEFNPDDQIETRKNE
ncbi:MAG TPA: hypothetical protein VFT37_08480, partial [Telluria sp.]|nr:hypothetical protein [Telluria sp.]